MSTDKMKRLHQAGQFTEAANIMDLVTSLFTASESFNTRSLDSVMYTILQIFTYLQQLLKFEF